MGWIHAAWIPAEMVNMQALRDGPFMDFVGKAMGHYYNPTLIVEFSESSIFELVSGGIPDPTRRAVMEFIGGYFELLEESNIGR